jgi:hypothetical protein
MFDEPSEHFPDRLEVEIHTDPENMARSETVSIPLYADGKGRWKSGADTAGEVDVAAIEVGHTDLENPAAYRAFTPDHLDIPWGQIEVGTPVLMVGFPLGFHDTLHHMPVVRRASIASSFGLRFQGEGYFLTDARAHRGTSGSPVVMRIREGGLSGNSLPYWLLGVHSARLDVGSRDMEVDEALGLNCAWYADILMKLTE